MIYIYSIPYFDYIYLLNLSVILYIIIGYLDK